MMEFNNNTCLKKANHYNERVNFFSEILESERFLDVRLIAEDKFIDVHRIVLGLCSPYFDTLLSSVPGTEATMIFHEVPFEELQALVDLLYKGETRLKSDRIQSFLRTAESLQIRGLEPILKPFEPVIKPRRDSDLYSFQNPSRSEATNDKPRTMHRQSIFPPVEQSNILKIEQQASIQRKDRDVLSESSRCIIADLINGNQAEELPSKEEITIKTEEILVPELTISEPLVFYNLEQLSFPASEFDLRERKFSIPVVTSGLSSLSDSGASASVSTPISSSFPETETVPGPKVKRRKKQENPSANVADLGTLPRNNKAASRNKLPLRISKDKKEDKYVCARCSRVYRWKGSLYNHLRFECGVPRSFKCQTCNAKFHRKDHLKTHLQSRCRRDGERKADPDAEDPIHIYIANTNSRNGHKPEIKPEC